MHDRTGVKTPTTEHLRCAMGHKIRQREWIQHSACINGQCLLPNVCPIAHRAEVLKKVLP